MSAPTNCRSKNIVVEPIVIFELTFRDVERKVLGADLVIAANDAALEDAPKALNRVRMNCADHITAGGVERAPVVVFIKPIVDFAFVGRQQANLVGNNLTHKSVCIFFADELQNAGHYVALALNGTNDGGLGRDSMFAALTALADVFVAVLPADPSLIDFDDTAKLVHVALDQGGTDFVTHAPSGFYRTKAHVAAQLPCADALLSGEHQVSNFVPVAERLVRVLENGPGDMGEPIAGRASRSAGRALPMVAGSQRIDLGIATAGAMDALRPAPGHQIGNTIVLGDEHGVELGAGELVDGFRFTGHGGSPSFDRRI